MARPLLLFLGRQILLIYISNKFLIYIPNKKGETMKKLLLILCALILAVGFAVPSFSMTITPFDSAANLAQSLVGSGVTISNVNYTGAEAASGYFTGGVAAGIGIESGIVLTSGFASHLNGTENTSGGITGNNGLGGTSYLNDLNPGFTTYDATVLEFDFMSSGNAAYFSYVFGSDEYNEYVGSNFNDVFGFFLNGTAVTDNVATLGDGTVVSINNINNGSNSSYYNDNGPGPFAFEYDGFTKVLTASLLGLTPDQSYHLTLAIADAGDYILDSGVFLAAGTLSDVDPGNGNTSNPVPEPSTILLMGVGLIGLAGYSRKKFNKKS
jgi:hypothetical protein